jgi:hypothetical protein
MEAAGAKEEAGRDDRGGVGGHPHPREVCNDGAPGATHLEECNRAAAHQAEAVKPTCSMICRRVLTRYGTSTLIPIVMFLCRL